VPLPGVLLVRPDSCEVRGAEAAVTLEEDFVVESAVDGRRAPSWFEDDGVPEDGVLLKVEDDAEVVKIAA
jgi:hypothetical protein